MPIQLDVDHASFAYDEDNALVEIYLAFEAATLTYTAAEGGFLAELPIRLALMRSTHVTLDDTPTDPVWSEEVPLVFMVPDTTSLVEGQHFVHQVRASVAPGEYELEATVPSGAPGLEHDMSVRRDVLVPNYARPGSVAVSDVTLASQISPSQNKDDLFFKNGLVIRPNANQLFGSGLNFLFYYAEAYGLDQLDASTGKYTVFTYIAQANIPQPMPDYQRRVERTVRNPDVLVGSFNIKELPSGSYFLRIALLNENNEAITEQSRKFFVYNPEVQVEQQVTVETDFESSQYAHMDEEEVDRMQAHIRAIASDSEWKRLRSIKDLDERRRFMMDFWQARDPNPSTPVNEFQENFYALVQYANDRYTTSFTEGWESDRGQVLLKYGTPTAVEPHLFDRGMEPYEIWEYNNIPGEGQSMFVFADLDGFGRFELLHSSVTGERQEQNWQSVIRK